MNDFEETIASIFPKGDNGDPAFVVTFDPKNPVIGIPLVIHLHRIKVDTQYTISITVKNEKSEQIAASTQQLIIHREEVKNAPSQLFEDGTVLLSFETTVLPVSVKPDQSEILKISVVLFSDEISNPPVHTYLTTRAEK